jgi:hypothetical protein
VELTLEGLAELLGQYKKQTAKRLEGLQERQLEVEDSAKVWYSSLLSMPAHKDYGDALKNYQIETARQAAEDAISMAGEGGTCGDACCVMRVV